MEKHKQTCNYCHRQGHTVVECMFRRRFLQRYFERLLGVTCQFDEGYPCAKHLQDCPFSMNDKYLSIRLFRDLVMILDTTIHLKVNNETLFSYLKEVRDHGHLQCSQRWWNDHHWEDFIRVISSMQ